MPVIALPDEWQRNVSSQFCVSLWQIKKPNHQQWLIQSMKILFIRENLSLAWSRNGLCDQSNQSSNGQHECINFKWLPSIPSSSIQLLLSFRGDSEQRNPCQESFPPTPSKHILYCGMAGNSQSQAQEWCDNYSTWTFLLPSASWISGRYGRRYRQSYIQEPNLWSWYKKTLTAANHLSQWHLFIY